MNVVHQLQVLFEANPNWALVLSLALSIIIAIAGIIPSVFVTAANIGFFGFWVGTAISYAGETLGAAISFLVYRYCFKNKANNKLHKYPKVERLIHLPDNKKFVTVITLRILPFIPSGLVTFAAAISQMQVGRFVLASSIGKLPALLLEASAIYGFLNIPWYFQLLLTLAGIIFIVFNRKFYTG